MATAHGVFLSILAGTCGCVVGWVAGVPLRDTRGVLGWLIGGLALISGLTWMMGV